MAEELDIKSIWERGKALEDPASLAIDKLERKGTGTTLYWIKTILWIEFWLSIVLIPVMSSYFLKVTESTSAVSIYVGLTVVYLFYYQFLIRKIKQFSYDGNVVQSLRKVYGYLRFYLLHYKVVIWLSLLVGFVYGLANPANPEDYAALESTKDWVLAIAFSALLLGIVGGIMHFLVHLIYGRKIKRLQTMVKDLEREE